MRNVNLALVLACLGVLSACAESEAPHPWIDLGADSPHQILEFSGSDAGQVVIAMEPTVTREEALALGERIRSQAPPGATVNVRLYNDQATAAGWRTAAADMRVAHLLVVVSTNSATGEPEVRWVRPDSLDAEAAPGGPVPVAPGDSAEAPADSI